MKCSNCGAEIGTNTQCAYCGTVQQQETPVSQQGVPVPPPYPTQQPYNGQPNVQQPPYTVPPQAAQQNPNGVPPYSVPPQAPQPPYPYGVPQQPPYPGQAPMVVNPSMQKSKIVAGLLGIFLGSFGIHNFYLGFTNKAVLQIILSVVTCGVAGIWGFIEGILILVGNINTDAQGIPLKD